MSRTRDKIKEWEVNTRETRKCRMTYIVKAATAEGAEKAVEELDYSKITFEGIDESHQDEVEILGTWENR